MYRYYITAYTTNAVVEDINIAESSRSTSSILIVHYMRTYMPSHDVQLEIHPTLLLSATVKLPCAKFRLYHSILLSFTIELSLMD